MLYDINLMCMLYIYIYVPVIFTFNISNIYFLFKIKHFKINTLYRVWVCVYTVPPCDSINSL